MASYRERRHGLTLVEVLVAACVMSVVILMLYNAVRFFFSRQSKSSLITMTDRAFANHDLRYGLRQLMMRVREGTKIISPLPGSSSNELVLRDLLNHKIRLRIDPASKRLISELFLQGEFLPETLPFEVTTPEGDNIIVTRPIKIPACSSAAFTTLSPSCVVVSLTVASGHVEESWLTSIHLRNFRMAY